MRLQDKIAIVTGGGSGMGKEVATRFVAEGGSVLVNGRSAPKAEAAAREIDPAETRVPPMRATSRCWQPAKRSSRRRSTGSLTTT